MSIRPCRLQDFRAVHQLVSDNFRHLISESSLRYWLCYERPGFYVARRQGRIAAFIHVQPRPAEGALWLNMIAVDSELRGQGIAGEMLGFCEQLATEIGFRKVALQCLTDNTPALAFYEQAAYRRVGASSYKSMGLSFFMYEKPVPERPVTTRTTQGMRKDPMLLCKAHRLFYLAWISWRSGLVELNKS
ncbi:GNAT family N-acetyltransferase [uncultured Sphaerotilus sp.]|uniref:GNAT family N-acetyltransferase n=1 Tax=uncultured Sphaerotilus sp. TaxID=474984 RepID=UPI0030CA279C